MVILILVISSFGPLLTNKVERLWQVTVDKTSKTVICKVMAKPCILTSYFGGCNGLLQEYVDAIENHFRIICFEDYDKNKEVLASEIQAVFVWNFEPKVDRELLQSLSNVKIIISSGAGVDHLDIPMISSFGISVANAPDGVDDSTADTGMMLMLASARNLVEGACIATSPDTKCFPLNMVGVEVSGATLGIIGMGRIGYKVAQRAKGFDMKILYHNRRRRKMEEEAAVGAFYCNKVEDLLQQSDFVMLVVNLTPETQKLIGKRELQLMKPTATLINICRGQVVDQDALVEALQQREIRAAALDVTYPEPLPRDHPLLRLPNVIVTPHIGSSTFASCLKVAEQMVANALAALGGLPIPNKVN
ncbi:probable 2-ketogluconate reductase isoform X2 [Latimeria chalumnae]|uniref:probable 2-ketogluconate reductase isoform X2 n=1 Tax=Latimeria chalumnae TaxID=7897 RepID=UPI00313F08AD